MKADIQLNYITNGVEQVKKDYKTVLEGAKKISESPTKITMKSEGIQETIDAFGRLKNEIPKLTQVYNSLQNKSTVAAKAMLKDLTNIQKVCNELSDTIAKQGKVSDTVYNNFKMSGSIESQLKGEKEITDEKKKQQTIIEQQEKDLDSLRKQIQSISRLMSDQQNAGKTGKKGKTPYDIAWAIEQYKTLNAEAEKLAATLGEDNEAVKHFRNAIAWTEANNPIRALRDEATKLIPKIAQAEAELKKLNVDPTKNASQISQTTKSLEEMKTKYKEIENGFQQAIDKIKEDKSGIFDAQDLEAVQNTLNVLKEQLETLTKIKTVKAEARTEDKLSEQSYQELKHKIQEIYSLEEKLEKLKKDKNGNRPEIQVTEEILNNKKKELDIDTEISKQNGQRRTELEAIRKKHQENLEIIEAQKDKISNLGDTIQKVFNYVLVYRGFQMLTDGIRQALDTMKELDKAFTDIQMVTMDSDEQTAQLAQSYNKLAKEMGATTVEVAEGAAEWFNESRDHLKTLELLETRED